MTILPFDYDRDCQHALKYLSVYIFLPPEIAMKTQAVMDNGIEISNTSLVIFSRVLNHSDAAVFSRAVCIVAWHKYVNLLIYQ